MGSSPNSSGWDNVSSAYVHVERLTTPLCHRLVSITHSKSALDASNATAFDDGCGTGVLTVVLKEQYPSLPIFASDVSPGMIDLFERRIADAGWKDVDARTLDSRKLDGVADASFSHCFSGFMVCLAPDPEEIVKEMHRVTKPGGVLGLAVWADPYFGVFNEPFTKACRTLMPDYESVAIMDSRWTRVGEVKERLVEAGWRNVEAREEKQVWKWGNVEEFSKYFFEGGNPANETMMEMFKKKGGSVAEVKGEFEKLVVQEYGKEDGRVEGSVLACLATAMK